MILCCFWGPHVRSHDLLVPREPGELAAEQLAADFTRRPVAPDDVVRLKPLLPLGRPHVHPRLVLILADSQDLVAEQHPPRWVPREVLVHQRQQLVQGQRHVRLLPRRVVRQERAHLLKGLLAAAAGGLEDPPAHAIGNKGRLHDVLHQTRAPQLVYGRRVVEARARVAVYLVALLEDGGGDTLLRQHQGQEEARRACPDDDDL